MEPRKATDLLLEIEQKLDVVLSIVKNQDQIIKILSNKLNNVLETLEAAKKAPPKITVEAVNTIHRPTTVPIPGPLSDREIPILADEQLPMEDSPKGFRRNSRPETFISQPAPPPAPKPNLSNPNVPPPGRSIGEVLVPSKATKKVDMNTIPKSQQPLNPATINLNAVPVQQRVVNEHGKSLFLADIEIVNLASMETVSKTRTNGTGKWMASLGVGEYRVFIRKLDSATKERLEITQDISVDGQQSPLELKAIIVKAG